MSGPARLFPLAGNQRAAADPGETVWLSASAGTGKTQVLTARVLRLLLEPGVRPEQILCLTFTRAGATEMAARINDTLARWVRQDDTALFAELEAIGADAGPERRARARTLFAAVLDCPGGGLRIDTIHAFSQWLLAAFPEEAGLSAGARPMEEQEKALLSRQVLADLLLDAEARGDEALLSSLAALSLRMGEEAALGFLMACAGARALWFGPGSWQVGPLDGRVRAALGLPRDADAGWLAGLCADDVFPAAALRRCMAAYGQWPTKTGEKGAAALGDWLAAAPMARLEGLDLPRKTLFTAEGELRANERKAFDKIDPGAVEAAETVRQALAQIAEARALLALAAFLAPALELGRAYALAWAEVKAREGLIDFDDQIDHAADLLSRSDMAEWIRYKLDRRFEHVLVDEAQDTNAAQWRIIEALIDDFFAGESAHGSRARTLFVVGDYKQAIFGFQGTSPENFEEARKRIAARMAGAAANAGALRDGPVAQALRVLDLGRSFRTAANVLHFVDRAIESIGHGQFGLAQPPEPHVGQDWSGHVALWQPVGLAGDDTEDEEGEEAQNWTSGPERELASRIALQVKHWVDHGFPLVKGGARRASAGDVMILVRRRRELAGLIVARLHAAGVPVAGVDRLRLGAPLAVRDLVAALRFAAQPLDDLNLASLLVSPLIGWTQEQLLAHGWREDGVRLWDHLRRSAHADVAAAMDLLGALLARADYQPVQALLHWLLVGPWQGRRRLLARLGREAADPIDELLNAAHAYAASATPSLAGFLAWFEAGDGELKREAAGAGDQVRVMTVHGSKGLQAPIVILADATGAPGKGRIAGLPLDDARAMPLPGLRKGEAVGPIAKAGEAALQAERQEHWRLLYVAMTRAEEALFVTGALGAREDSPAPDSWYARLAGLFAAEDWVDDPIWGRRAELAPLPPVPPRAAESLGLPLPEALPGWATRPPPEEPRPARPLAPSSLGEDLAADPPAMAANPAAARAGTLLHRLLERLPALEPAARTDAAHAWLDRQAADLPAAERAAMAASALAVIADPRWAELFEPGALAEVPIAALVNGQVISGTIDRLVLGETRIRLVDFKSARRPPADLAGVPVAILRQMAAYAAALEAAYPGRPVEAALLYTHAPLLIEIPQEVLAVHKQRLALAQESFDL